MKRIEPHLVLALLVLVGCATGTPRAADPPPIAITYTPIEEPEAPSPDESLPEVPLEPLETPTEEPGDSLAMTDAEPVGDVSAQTPEALLAQSLGVYEEAQEHWQHGDLEQALASLDLAYASMAEARADGDPVLLRQQEDLRRLIARRVVEVYASRRTVVGDVNASIPMVMNEQVEREIRSFQGPEREEFLAAYQRSGLYRPMIVEALREAGLPEQLSWLPMVESWYKVRALSRARALGMWQFIPSTGYRFGLRRTDWLDERMDPEKSTAAALAYLTELHEMFGDWLTSIAGYNCGEARVLRTINRQRVAYLDRFWDLYELLPRETRRYVPRFLAVLHVVQDPAAYGFDDLPTPFEPVAVRTMELDRGVRLGDLEQSLDLPQGTLAALNPELRRGATPGGAYALRLPESAEADRVIAAVEASPKTPAATVSRSSSGVHVVRSGESLSAIASRYGVTTGTLARLNGLSNPNQLRVGQRLRVTGSAPGGASGRGPITYTVRAGDSLWRIASRHGTTVDRIRRDNGLRSNTLRPGQRLRVATGSGGGAVYVVQRGDTLGGIARSRRVSTRRLAEANGLSLRSTIFPGQQLVIPE